MIKREELLRDRQLLLDKARGSLCGLAIGDSLGDAARKPENQKDYGITTDFQMGASWSTDDTEFALLVAEIIINTGGEFTSRDVEAMWLKHVAVQDGLNRGGASEIEACENLRRGLHAPQSGMFNSFSHSDGAAMRSGPIGILCAGDPEKAKILAREDAEVSHCREGVWAAQAVAAAVSLAMVDAPMGMIFDTALNAAPEGSWLRYAMEEAYRIVDEAKGDIADAWMPLHYSLFRSYRATSAEAVPQVFGCLRLENSSFRSGVILAANFGRDADTIGAIAGAILGAKYGLKGIPEKWTEKTRYPSGTCLQFTKGADIIEKADRIAEIMLKIG